MTAIAPNGALVSDYNPIGIGSVVFASVTRADANAAGFATKLDIGETLSGTVLYPASINSNTSGTGSTVTPSTSPIGEGVWKCLGGISELNSGVRIDFATLWMRVS